MLWSEAALVSERKLHHDLVDYDEGFLTNAEVATYAPYEDLKPVLQLAEQADRHWRGRIAGFEFDRPGPSRKYTLRHLYSPVYRTLSEGVHGAPQALRANMEVGPLKRVSVGELEVANVFLRPLIVTLYSKALLVSATRSGGRTRNACATSTTACTRLLPTPAVAESEPAPARALGVDPPRSRIPSPQPGCCDIERQAPRVLGRDVLGSDPNPFFVKPVTNPTGPDCRVVADAATRPPPLLRIDADLEGKWRTSPRGDARPGSH